MNRLFRSIFLIFFSLIPSLVHAQTFTETHYVTQNGSGSKTGRSLANAWALSDFHNTANWNTIKIIDSKIGPNDVVYFSGTFTDRVIVTRGGTSAGSITLDGYEAGDCNPLNALCSSSALLQQGIESYNSTTNIEYLTFQDFRITDPNGKRPTVQFRSNAPNYNVATNYIIFRRNYIFEAGDGFFTFFHGRYNIVVDNKFYIFGRQNNPPAWITQGAVFLIEFSNSLFARNEVGHDNSPIVSGSGGSPELVSTFGCQNVLIERNNLYGTPGQTGLRPKEHPSWRPANYNNVIRFNKIHNNHHTEMGGGIHIHTRVEEPISDFYVYGNYIYSNGTDNIRIGRGVSNVYVWANIISSARRIGFSVWAAANNIHVYNNTIAYNNTSGEADVSRGGMSLASGSNVNIKNNIFWNNRPAGETNRLQVVLWITPSSLEHNTYYHLTGTPHIYYANSHRTIGAMQSSYGFENDSPSGAVRNPVFIDPNGADNVYGTADDNYKLQASSPERGSGTTLSGSFSVNLSGGDAWFQSQTGYGMLTFGFDDALDPLNTNWTTNPPTVESAKQNENGSGWEKGAYVYRDTSQIELLPPKITNVQPIAN